MAMNIGTVEATIMLKTELSLWQALKMRISGMYKNIDSYEQVGQVVKIKYK